MVDALDKAISLSMGDELPPETAPETDTDGTDANASVDSDDAAEQSVATGKTRDDKGRFLSKQDKAPGNEAPSTAPQQPETSPEAKPAAEKPVDYAAGRLTPEQKAILDQLPPDASSLVKQILAAQDASHTRRMMDVSNAKKEFAALDTVMAPNRTRWQAHGVSDAQAIQNLLAVESLMMRDPAGTLHWLADQYGVKLQQPAEAPMNGAEASVNAAPQQALAIDPAVFQRIQNLEQQLQGVVGFNQQQTVAQMQGVVDRVRSEHPMKDFIPLVEGQVAKILPYLRSENPSDQPEVLLKRAIDTALRANDQTYAILVDQERKAEREKLAGTQQSRVEKARRAAASVRGAPASGNERMSRSLDEIIASAIEG